jgi:hypothetical protein
VSSAYKARNYSVTAQYDYASLKPPCSTVDACFPTAVSSSQTAAHSCHLVARSPTVVYWPVSSNQCDPKAVLETATPTIQGRPNTAVFSGVTITSPSALVILHSVHGRYTSGEVSRSCGPIIPSASYLVPTQVLSSMSWSFAPNAKETRDAKLVPKSFNLADLDVLPFGPYANQKGCNTELLKTGTATPPNCPTKIVADYNPSLAVLSHATGLSGQFKGCRVGVARSALYIPITAAKVELPTPTSWGATVKSTTEFPGASTTEFSGAPTPVTSNIPAPDESETQPPPGDFEDSPFGRPDDDDENNEDVFGRMMVTSMETAKPTSQGRI